MFIGGKVHFMVENRPSSQIENFITYLLIFHNFRSLASFSHHFWIIQWILQPLITNGIITINKIKKAVCTQTPCINLATHKAIIFGPLAILQPLEPHQCIVSHFKVQFLSGKVSFKSKAVLCIRSRFFIPSAFTHLSSA